MNFTIYPLITENDRKLPFYLVGVGYSYPQEHVIRHQGYPSYQWLQCYEGEGKLLIRGKEYTVKPGQGFFLYPNEPHEYYEVKKGWKVDWITFTGYDVENFLKTIGIEESGVFHITNSERLLFKIKKVRSTAQTNNSLKGLECSSMIYDLLIDIYKYTSKNKEDSIQQKYIKLQPVFEYIDQSYAEVITLEQLSQMISVTPQHLCLLFKESVQIRPFEYINEVRINKSKDLLNNNKNMKIKEIAMAVGYDSTSYYCSIFKKIEGISPGSFRKLL